MTYIWACTELRLVGRRVSDVRAEHLELGGQRRISADLAQNDADYQSGYNRVNPCELAADLFPRCVVKSGGLNDGPERIFT